MSTTVKYYNYFPHRDFYHKHFPYCKHYGYCDTELRILHNIYNEVDTIQYEIMMKKAKNPYEARTYYVYYYRELPTNYPAT
jgi:hypothetical protein